MATTKAEHDAAVQAWLDAHAGYKQYVQATENLFTVFADGWCGPRRALTEAFDSYRSALLRHAGYSPTEVNEAYPKPHPECQ